ncbi:hypothetical protein ATANTOWER_017748 [Ataeniobius toweri]|uniref:Uncharacterized protein n=1 Tax=Ataeniobius toweri TaxID=208326 RepID=A0ABU7BUC0_9TELE|nr:hypothetical protein [Ataeniobius toweri]
MKVAPLKPLLFTLETGPVTEAHLWRRRGPMWILHLFSFVGQRKIHERGFWNEKARNFTLPIEDVSLTCNQKPRSSRRRNFPSLFGTSRLLTVRSYFSEEAKRQRLTTFLEYPRTRGTLQPPFFFSHSLPQKEDFNK